MTSICSHISSDFIRIPSLTVLNLPSSFPDQIPSEMAHLSKLVSLTSLGLPSVIIIGWWFSEHFLQSINLSDYRLRVQFLKLLIQLDLYSNNRSGILVIYLYVDVIDQIIGYMWHYTRVFHFFIFFFFRLSVFMQIKYIILNVLYKKIYLWIDSNIYTK